MATARLEFAFFYEFQQFQKHNDWVGFSRHFLDVSEGDLVDDFLFNWDDQSGVLLAV